MHLLADKKSMKAERISVGLLLAKMDYLVVDCFLFVFLVRCRTLVCSCTLEDIYQFGAS